MSTVSDADSIFEKTHAAHFIRSYSTVSLISLVSFSKGKHN